MEKVMSSLFLKITTIFLSVYLFFLGNGCFLFAKFYEVG